VHVEWALLCRQVLGLGTQADIIGAGEDVRVLAELPGHVDATIAFRVHAPDDDQLPESARAEVDLVSPSGRSVRFEAPISFSGEAAAGERVASVVGMPIAFVAAETGRYELSLRVDGELHPRPLPLRVVIQ
jgi:hypothetical protein